MRVDFPDDQCYKNRHMAFLLVYITHPDENTARQIADQLVEKRLAACANIFPVSSAFWWDEHIQHEQEWVSLIKTRLSLEARIEAEVAKMHPYEVPCIMRFAVNANAAYEQWIGESTLDT